MIDFMQQVLIPIGQFFFLLAVIFGVWLMFKIGVYIEQIQKDINNIEQFIKNIETIDNKRVYKVG